MNTEGDCEAFAPAVTSQCNVFIRYFTWDKHFFPDPIAMQDNLAASGRKLVTIIDPHIKRDSGYYIYKEGQEKGLYVLNKDKQEFDG